MVWNVQKSALENNLDKYVCISEITRQIELKFCVDMNPKRLSL